MALTIDENLNLVLPVGDLKVYHTPISRQVFEANYKALAVTSMELDKHGIDFQMYAAPRIASLTLKDELRKVAGFVEIEGKMVYNEETVIAFFSELTRLSMILIPTPGVWEMKPVSVAIASDKLNA